MKALALALLAALVVVAAASGASPSPSRVQIVAREYSYTLSRLHVKAGTAIIELDNFGQDAHDLRLQRVGSSHVAGLGKVGAGKLGDLTLHLAPGRYLLWCSLQDHRKLGMRASLVVTR
jgi:plastocyanin